MPPKKAFAPTKRACDTCYAKKTVCSLPTAEGPCERCVYRSLDCTFDREKRSKKRKAKSSSSEPADDNQNIIHRIDQLENSLRSLRQEFAGLKNPERTCDPSNDKERDGFPQESSSTPLSSPGATVILKKLRAERKPKKNSSSRKLGPNWYFNGISISSEVGRQWISARSDQDIEWSDLCISETELSPLSAVDLLSVQEVSHLPDQDSTRAILRDFFQSSFGTTFPILDQLRFEETLQSAYALYDGINPFENTAAKACVLAALSIAAGIKTIHDNPPIDAKMCAAKSQLLLADLTRDISLEALQAALLLQLQHMLSGRWQVAAFFNSTTCRIICSLGGHIVYDPSQVDETTPVAHESCHIRKLFCLCYILDKDTSLRTGHPPLLTEAYCDLTDVTVPADLSKYYYTDMPSEPVAQVFEVTNSFQGYHASHFPGDIRLSVLKEKVYRELFSASASKHNDDQLLLHIRKLDNELESWRQSLPSDVRPALLVSQTTLPDISEIGKPYMIRRMCLQLEYHHLVTVIHTTVRKCTPDSSNETEDLHSVVHSSFDISLVASRSTLVCLKFILEIVPEEAFRFITSYLSTAVLALFLDILIHPLGPQAQLDLEEILMSASNMEKSVISRHLTKDDCARFLEETKFVTRLWWLGTCAITKADRELHKEKSQSNASI